MPRFVHAKFNTANKPVVTVAQASVILGHTLRELLSKSNITLVELRNKINAYVTNTAVKLSASMKSILASKLYHDLTAEKITPTGFSIALKIIKL